MAPKTRASSSASQPTTSSQAEPQQRTTRPLARQRRASDASNTSDVPSSSHTKTPAKGRRPNGKNKATTPAPTDTIDEEAEDDLEARATTPKCEGFMFHDDLDNDDVISTSQPTTKQVHFTPDLPEENRIDIPTATSITPHLRKMTVKRRRSDSPSTDGSVKRIKSSRTSLPPTLSTDDPTQVIQEHSFAPLRVVLQERIRRLSSLKQAVVPSAGLAQLDGASDDLHNDMLVLNAHTEFTVPQLPATPCTPIPKDTALKAPATPGAFDRAQWATERSHFHDAIIALQKEADEATGRLRILDIELESLGLANKGTPSLQILQSIRNSFAKARDFLETDLPGALPEHATNDMLVESLINSVEEFADRLHTADKELSEKDELVGDLVRQTNGILDQLAAKEVENTDVCGRVNSLEKDVASKQQDIKDLNLELNTITKENAELQIQRENEQHHMDNLLTEKEGLENNISRLSTSLRDYQADVRMLTEKVNSLEQEHSATVAAMNKEREETVRDLEIRLDDVTGRHMELTADHQSRSEMIKELESNWTLAKVERDRNQDGLRAAESELRDAMEEREMALTELDEKIAETKDLEERVQLLDEELDQHEDDLEELRGLHQTEYRQREAAEREVDTRGERIDELNEKLQEQGKLANELRQKLFEIQTNNEAKIQELQQLASERDLQFQHDMAMEVSRREEAEIRAQERQGLITNLEQQLEDLECEMRDTLSQRDKELASLKEDGVQRDIEILNLRDSLRSTQEDREKEVGVIQERIRDLEGEVKALLNIIAESEAANANLEEQATKSAKEHEIQIEECNATAAVLEHELAGLKARHIELEKDKARLEYRVQEEAEFLLVFQNEKNAEVDELQRTIQDKQAKLQTVEELVHETDRRWQDLLFARDDQIASLTATEESQATAITALQHKFGDYARRASSFIARLQGQVDAAKTYVDDEGEGLQVEGQQLVRELEGAAISGTSSQKGKGKKRKVDSGIGIASPAVMLS